MFRIGNLVRRLQRESAEAKPSPEPAKEVVEAPIPPEEALSPSESISDVHNDEVSVSGKQKRHMVRRQRQRERKQFGKVEEVDLDQLNSEILAPSSQVGEESAVQSSDANTWNYTSVSVSTWFKVTENNANQGQFFKSCKWSPNGDRLALVGGENGILKVVGLSDSVLPPDAPELSSSLSNQVCQSDCIYEYAWYPFSNAQLENSSLIVIGARSRPVQLWDAVNGTLRASYQAYDHLERVCAPNSLTFSLDGSQIYCGFDGVIRSFPIDQPGTSSTEYWTKGDKKRNSKMSSKSSKSISNARYHNQHAYTTSHSSSALLDTTSTEKNENFSFNGFNSASSEIENYNMEYGFNGIISTLSTVPSNPYMLIGGSFSGDLAVFDLTTFSQQVSIQVPYAVTQVKSSPCGTRLYAAGRNSNAIDCFDLRMPNQPLWTVQRLSNTNQRIAFDIDYTGSLLMSGSVDGSLKLWNLCLQATPVAVSISGMESYEHDGINCAQFHPYGPNYFAVTTGQRRILPDLDYDSDSDTDSETRLPIPRSELFVGYSAFS